MNDKKIDDLRKKLAGLDVGRLRGRLTGLVRASWLPEPEPAVVEALLRRRAEELARPMDPEPDETGLELLEFRLGAERFGLGVAWATVAAQAREITAIPCAPAGVIGCLSLRGHVYSVLDARPLLGRPGEGERRAAGPVIILQGPDMEFGLLVDEILGVIRLPGQASVAPAPVAGPYVLGAVCLETNGSNRLLTLLDGQALLNDATLVCREEVGD